MESNQHCRLFTLTRAVQTSESRFQILDFISNLKSKSMEITQRSRLISLRRVDGGPWINFSSSFASPCDPGTYPRPALLDPQYPRTWLLYPSANILAKGSRDISPGYKSGKNRPLIQIIMCPASNQTRESF